MSELLLNRYETRERNFCEDWDDGDFCAIANLPWLPVGEIALRR
jgi:hypothetical protein